MSGPWEKYQTAKTEESGPWTRYAQSKEPSMLDEIKQGAGNIAAGVASGFADVGDTILNAVGKLAEGNLPKKELERFRVKGAPKENYSNEERSASLDQFNDARKDSAAFGVGRVAGNIAATYPVGGALAKGVQAVAPTAVGLANALATGGMRAGATPGAMNMLTRVVGGGATGAAAAGLVDPESAKTGAAIGAALPPALASLGKVGHSIGRSFAIGNGNRDLARVAIEKYKLPLGVGDIAEGGTTKALRSILNDAPFSGGVGAAQRESVQEGFNRAVGGTFGAPEAKLTPEVIDAAKKRMGAEFDRLWGQNQLQVDGQLIDKLNTLRQQAAKLPRSEGRSLIAELDDLTSKIIPDEAGGAVIPGDVANKFQSYLRRRAEGSAGLKNELGDLRKAVISAFNRGIKPEDAAALTANRAQYKAFKTVEPLLNSAEAGVAGRMPGDVPAALLPQAVARSYSQAGGTPLAELAQIGSRFIVDRTPRTGGSMRAALQNTALGTALVGGGLSNPMLAAGAIPAAAGVNALLGSPALAQYLLKDAPQNAFSKFIASPEVGQIVYRAAPVVSAR